jgi:hypothetical protein
VRVLAAGELQRGDVSWRCLSVRKFSCAPPPALHQSAHLVRSPSPCALYQSAYLYSLQESNLPTLRKEADAAIAAGLGEVDLVDELPELPQSLGVKGGLRFGSQAQFNVYTFVRRLAEVMASTGQAAGGAGGGSGGGSGGAIHPVAVYEHTRVVDVTGAGAPHEVVTEAGVKLTADAVVLDRSMHFAVTEPDRSYVIAVELADPSAVPQQMYVNPEKPLRSLRAAGPDNGIFIVSE